MTGDLYTDHIPAHIRINSGKFKPVAWADYNEEDPPGRGNTERLAHCYQGTEYLGAKIRKEWAEEIDVKYATIACAIRHKSVVLKMYYFSDEKLEGESWEEYLALLERRKHLHRRAPKANQNRVHTFKGREYLGHFSIREASEIANLTYATVASAAKRANMGRTGYIFSKEKLSKKELEEKIK